MKKVIGLILAIVLCLGIVDGLAAGVAVKSVKVSPQAITLLVGKKYTLSATISPSNASNKTVTWSSSNKNVATVTSDGVVTAKNTGKATITAKTSNGKKASATVTVVVNPTSVKINSGNLELHVGDRKTLSAKVSPSDAYNSVTWSSSDSKVAEVNQAGVVTTRGTGKAKITVKTTNNKTHTIDVKVIAPKVKLQVSDDGICTWKGLSNAGVKYYEVRWGKASIIYPWTEKNIKINANANETYRFTPAESKMELGKDYKFQVRAYYKNGSKMDYTDWASVTRTIKPGAVTIKYLIKKDKVEISWNKARFAKTYHVVLYKGCSSAYGMGKTIASDISRTYSEIPKNEFQRGNNLVRVCAEADKKYKRNDRLYATDITIRIP